MSDICTPKTKSDRELLQELVDYIKEKAPNITTSEHVQFDGGVFYKSESWNLVAFKTNNVEIYITKYSLKIEVEGDSIYIDIEKFISEYKNLIKPELERINKEAVKNKKQKIKQLEKELKSLKI
jgi:hypothetical protein